MSLAIGIDSFRKNVSAGSYSAAAVDGVGVVADAILAAIPVAPGIAGLGIKAIREGGEVGAKGGTYLLKDAEGIVMRTGRTKDLARRELEHARDPALKDLDFSAVHRTDVRAEQRGLEQMLHDQYNPPLNAIRPISPRNPRLQTYMDAARDFLGIN
ncbi:hypothetical protein D3C71_1603250 [compost metagenome]